jgi:hypothetical protein
MISEELRQRLINAGAIKDDGQKTIGIKFVAPQDLKFNALFADEFESNEEFKKASELLQFSSVLMADEALEGIEYEIRQERKKLHALLIKIKLPARDDGGAK